MTQPALLDRFAATPVSAPQSSEALLRADVLRNLDALFNAVALEPGQEAWPSAANGSALDHVWRSCLNFGLPAWAGLALSPSRLRWLEDALTQAIRRFEPRLLPSPLTVSLRRVAAGGEGWSAGARLQVVILARMWLSGAPVPVSIVADLDADTRRAQLRLQSR
ncbi:type VI secretion system protein ImpF [Roseateles sp. YR242]|uniref:type VI secretion system baseplate subunit TssE n=1 Tax=Roseateles sp. YR242 TaxID=1855305 RepID=UPI0008AE51A1|nr:GPW/gp25 family protein [Roseateles sp. YR242]SEK22460.1 type VI secretion system protein ImpF [Roseateles sp. YR242]